MCNIKRGNFKFYFLIFFIFIFYFNFISKNKKKKKTKKKYIFYCTKKLCLNSEIHVFMMIIKNNYNLKKYDNMQIINNNNLHMVEESQRYQKNFHRFKSVQKMNVSRNQNQLNKEFKLLKICSRSSQNRYYLS